MRGRILKFTYKQSKSEELWSAAKKGGGVPHNTAKTREAPHNPHSAIGRQRHHMIPFSSKAPQQPPHNLPTNRSNNTSQTIIKYQEYTINSPAHSPIYHEQVQASYPHIQHVVSSQSEANSLYNHPPPIHDDANSPRVHPES